MINKFKNNFLSLNEALTIDELIDFMIEKKAFNENFIEMIRKSNELNKLTNVRDNKTKNHKIKHYNFNINKINNNYPIGYDEEKNKVTVDISGNTVFSYYDTENDLKNKLNDYINDEEYEKASVLYNFMKKCED